MGLAEPKAARSMEGPMGYEPVVVHYCDGRTLAGYAEEPPPGADELMVRDAAAGAPVQVKLEEVKVVCFVRSHATTGVVRHRESPPLFHAADDERRVELLFRDGERLRGTVTEAEPPTRGFYLAPLNPESNNRKVYVNPTEVAAFRFQT